MKKCIVSWVLVLAVVLTAAMPALAHSVPDMSRLGSIRVEMASGGNSVGGGSLTLYRAGEVAEHDGNYSFRAAEAFASFDAALQESYTGALAQEMAEHAKSMAGITAEISPEGVAVFSDLELGLYLVVQQEAAAGYCPVQPFLVAVPNFEDGEYRYDVDASPKVELIPEQTRPAEPSGPKDPSLPQTGQLNWPVPLLTVLGMGLFALGWILCFGRRKERYEK